MQFYILRNFQTTLFNIVGLGLYFIAIAVVFICNTQRQNIYREFHSMLA